MVRRLAISAVLAKPPSSISGPKSKAWQADNCGCACSPSSQVAISAYIATRTDPPWSISCKELTRSDADGSKRIMHAGDTSTATKDTTHYHRNIGNDNVVLIAVDVFHPAAK
ncbi:hypothetical protein SAMN05216338_10631 [Bradyrhizobium sp. Rc2d]|nr:hypothetical protein SAMN05216338_10631 [Bradyrhizobium sp. Rc2d]